MTKMEKILGGFIRALIFCVVIFVIFAVVFYATVFYQITDRNVSRNDEHVHFVLDWFGLSHKHSAQIENSYKLTGSWSGDWSKAFSIKLVTIDESDIIQENSVIRGDKVTPMIEDEVVRVIKDLDDGKTPWFPKREQIFSDQFYIVPPSMFQQDIDSSTFRVILIKPVDKMVYFYCYNN